MGNLSFCLNGENGIVIESCSAYFSVRSLFREEIGLPPSVDDMESFYDFLGSLDDSEYSLVVINSKYVLFCETFGTVESIQDIDKFVASTISAYEDYLHENET